MTDDRAVAARAASLLLRYPDAAVLAVLPTLYAAVEQLPHRLAVPLRAVADDYTATAPGDLAVSYVETFDFRRRCSLHLTFYTHGDTRARGQALLAFAAAYRAVGLAVDGGELPDYLPAVLDLAAVAGQPGWTLLHEYRVGVDLLRDALAREGSGWAPAADAVLRLLPPAAPPDLAAAAHLAAAGPPAERVGLAPYPVGGPR
jgi:nitrate reductase molybdenum cofactor assembly chaperone NarJ/NarW